MATGDGKTVSRFFTAAHPVRQRWSAVRLPYRIQAGGAGDDEPVQRIPDPTQRAWSQKFRDAFRGVWIGMHEQTSFNVHLVAAVLVILVAIVLRVSLWEWCLLLLCITAVLVAEMFNSAWSGWRKRSIWSTTIRSATRWTSPAPPS